MSKPQKPAQKTAFPAFRLGRSIEDEEEIALGAITAARESQSFFPSTKPVADLTQLTPAWLMIGADWSGKTTLARWLGDRAFTKNQQILLAALDPQNRPSPLPSPGAGNARRGRDRAIDRSPGRAGGSGRGRSLQGLTLKCLGGVGVSKKARRGPQLEADIDEEVWG